MPGPPVEGSDAPATFIAVMVHVSPSLVGSLYGGVPTVPTYPRLTPSLLTVTLIRTPIFVYPSGASVSSSPLRIEMIDLQYFTNLSCF